MSDKIRITDFNFVFSGYGHYKVTYVNPLNSKSYYCTTSNMQLIDLTKNAEHPKRIHLEQLKKLCKNNFKQLGYKW